MGCESSQVTRQVSQLKISIIDSSFLKPVNEGIRRSMKNANISYNLFVSLDCFLEELATRYYNKIVVRHEDYQILSEKLQQIKESPNVYVLLEGNKMEESLPANVKEVKDYEQLIKLIEEKRISRLSTNGSIKILQSKPFHIKILTSSGSNDSEETIIQASLKKNQIEHQFVHSFQELESSLEEGEPEFIIASYVYHRQVIELVRNCKTRVICYCQFDSQETYDPHLYAVSNNYLDIIYDIRNEMEILDKTLIKCTKAYLYAIDLPDYQEISSIISQFNIEIRPFTNLEKMMKETAFFFCATVLAAESQVKKLTAYFAQKSYLFKVKIISIPAEYELSIKGLRKIVRSVKKGYRAERTITNSIDIIDKHCDDVKFKQIKKELENQGISCFGFQNLSSYANNNKFISPFIICNLQERACLAKYLKQVSSKAKVILFCNQKLITKELRESPSLAFVNSHFGKIIKYIKKTPVFTPVIRNEADQKMNIKLQSVKNKNKRISALKWCGINQSETQSGENQQNFQFLNISESTNTGLIEDVQKSASSLFKVDSSITTDIESFKSDFIDSLRELVKKYKMSYPVKDLENLLSRINDFTMSDLQARIEEFFEAENQLGLKINQSLINYDSLEQKQVTYMKEFLLLACLGYFSGFCIPSIGHKKLKHWITNPLIEKCEVGSYLFCKNFLIFYQETPGMQDILSKYKIELQFDYDTLTEPELYLNSFITSKDKFIFSPFSQFQVESIHDSGLFKTIKFKYIKNTDFLKNIFTQNVYGACQNIAGLVTAIRDHPETMQIVDSSNTHKLASNLVRAKAIELFHSGQVSQAIETHKKLLKQAEEQENLDSALVNQINYELMFFYSKARDMEQVAAKLKELIDADPTDYILQQCQARITEFLAGELAGINDEVTKAFIELNRRLTCESQESEKDDEEIEPSDDNEDIENQFDFRSLELDTSVTQTIT